MANNFRLDIPSKCRRFGGADFDLRLQVADRFVEEFVKTVAPLKADDARDEVWTLAVRRRLIEICAKGCYALPDTPYSAKGEYLADYTWSEEGDMKRLLLACQTEWGTGWSGRTHWAPVERSFEKLLAVKAPFKVLIFSSCRQPDPLNPETDFSSDYAKGKLERSLRTYLHHLPGEVYIFVDFPQTRALDGDGKFQSLIWLSKRFGRQAVVLKKGPGGVLIRP